MFGPLPYLHRLLIVLGALAVCMGAGVWAGTVPEIPVEIGVGLLAGAGLGLATAFVLVHDFHRQQRQQPASVRRRHH